MNTKERSNLDYDCDILNLYFPHIYEKAVNIQRGYFFNELLVEEEDGSMFIFDVFTHGIRLVALNKYDMTEDEERFMISLRIQEILKHKRMTQTDLAEAAGMSQSTISRIVSGKTVPTILVAKKIADVLDCKVDDLLGYR